jgi:hypothetical protein
MACKPNVLIVAAKYGSLDRSRRKPGRLRANRLIRRRREFQRLKCQRVLSSVQPVKKFFLRPLNTFTQIAAAQTVSAASALNVERKV